MKKNHILLPPNYSLFLTRRKFLASSLIKNTLIIQKKKKKGVCLTHNSATDSPKMIVLLDCFGPLYI